MIKTFVHDSNEVMDEQRDIEVNAFAKKVDAWATQTNAIKIGELYCIVTTVFYNEIKDAKKR